MKKQKITVKALAELANLTPQRIYQLISEERLPAIVDGTLPRDESITRLFKFYQRDGEELKREKLLLTTANRQSKELELSQSKGKLIDRDIARNSITAFARSAHATVRQQVETYGPGNRRDKLSALGVSDLIVQTFFAWDIQAGIEVITKIEKVYADAGKLVAQ